MLADAIYKRLALRMEGWMDRTIIRCRSLAKINKRLKPEQRMT